MENQKIFFTVEIDKREEFNDLILWKQPENNKLKIANILDQDLTAFGKFGVLLVNSPWSNQASDSSTTGLTIHYPTLSDQQLLKINFGALINEVVALWITNDKFEVRRDILSKKNGFRIVEYVVCCKETTAGRIHSSQGLYLRHSKEIPLIATKWKPLLSKQRSSDVIMSKVLQQTRKPREVYELLDKLAPRVRKLEVFELDGGLFQDHMNGGKKFNITRVLEGSIEGDRWKHSKSSLEIKVLTWYVANLL
eukprot:snap_masked-scaffold_26-processed-gene-4.80-mRNA-1 protein AED:1.00 eAED:1.00 QI:0/0/0/0/1/1/3/0/250